jgi:hypothetical protein
MSTLNLVAAGIFLFKILPAILTIITTTLFSIDSSLEVDYGFSYYILGILVVLLSRPIDSAKEIGYNIGMIIASVGMLTILLNVYTLPITKLLCFMLFFQFTKWLVKPDQHRSFL